jgi:clan AA aspartic protease (TIGR02281 family)
MDHGAGAMNKPGPIFYGVSTIWVLIAAASQIKQPEFPHRELGRMDESSQCHVSGKMNKVFFQDIHPDSGATRLSFNREVARRIGINTAVLRYDRTVVTANGTINAATATVNELTIGAFTARNVDALVTLTDIQDVMLGMSALHDAQLQVGGGSCALVWK